MLQLQEKGSHKEVCPEKEKGKGKWNGNGSTSYDSVTVVYSSDDEGFFMIVLYFLRWSQRLGLGINEFFIQGVHIISLLIGIGLLHMRVFMMVLCLWGIMLLVRFWALVPLE